MVHTIRTQAVCPTPALQAALLQMMDQMVIFTVSMVVKLVVSGMKHQILAPVPVRLILEVLTALHVMQATLALGVFLMSVKQLLSQPMMDQMGISIALTEGKFQTSLVPVVAQAATLDSTGKTVLILNALFRG
jgi:uncharacterized membrane protein